MQRFLLRWFFADNNKFQCSFQEKSQRKSIQYKMIPRITAIIVMATIWVCASAERNAGLKRLGRVRGVRATKISDKQERKLGKSTRCWPQILKHQETRERSTLWGNASLNLITGSYISLLLCSQETWRKPSQSIVLSRLFKPKFNRAGSQLDFFRWSTFLLLCSSQVSATW